MENFPGPRSERYRGMMEYSMIPALSPSCSGQRAGGQQFLTAACHAVNEQSGAKLSDPVFQSSMIP